ncbi:MAG: hypothetical protein B7Y77_02990, partial [Bradyrhizobium sp. 35-63-5]
MGNFSVRLSAMRAGSDIGVAMMPPPGQLAPAKPAAIWACVIPARIVRVCVLQIAAGCAGDGRRRRPVRRRPCRMGWIASHGTLAACRRQVEVAAGRRF